MNESAFVHAQKKGKKKRVEGVVSLFVSVQSSRLAKTPLECLSLHAPLYVSEGDPQSQRHFQGNKEGRSRKSRKGRWRRRES